MRKSRLATPRERDAPPRCDILEESIRGSLQPEEKNQATDGEADAYQPIDELRFLKTPLENLKRITCNITPEIMMGMTRPRV